MLAESSQYTKHCPNPAVYIPSSSEEIQNTTKSRLLKACLALSILARMAEMDGVNPSYIIIFMKKNYSIRLSYGTVKPIFKNLSEKGYIRKLPNRRINSYTLANRGKEAIRRVQGHIPEFQMMIKDLVAIKQ